MERDAKIKLLILAVSALTSIACLSDLLFIQNNGLTFWQRSGYYYLFGIVEEASEFAIISLL